MKELLRKSSFRMFLLFIFILVISGFFVRITGVFSQNILFLYDNGRDLLYVKKIVIDHDLILIGPSSGGLQGYFHGVWWYYLLTIPFILGQGNPVASTLFMAIASTFSILIATIVIYLLTRSYVGAAFIAVVFSFSAFSVATSRFIWNPYPIVWLMPFYFAGIFLLSRRKPYALPLLALLTGFIFSFEAIYGIPLVLALMVFALLELIRKNDLQKKIKVIILSFLLFSLAFIPVLIFDVRHDFLISSSISKTIITGGSNITHTDNEKPSTLSERFNLRLQDLYTYTIGSVTNNALISLLVFVFSVLGFILLLKDRGKQDLFFAASVLLVLLVPFLVFLMLKYSVWSYYWIGSPPLYCLFISYLIGKAAKKNTTYRNIAFIFIAISFISFSSLRTLGSWQKGIIEEGPQTLSTELAIVDKIYKDADSEPFSVYVLTPPAYDYVYRYLFWRRGYYNYKTFPKKDKQNLIYLIIEPTSSDPQGNYFKENVVKTKNKPMEIFQFPGNVKVMKIKTDPDEEAIDPNYFPEL